MNTKRSLEKLPEELPVRWKWINAKDIAEKFQYDYTELLSQDYKNGKNNWAKTPLKRKLLESSALESSWIDFFFTSKLIIVGLDLSFSEIDLWWLLNFRARWLKEFGTKKNVPSIIIGEVKYLYPTFNSKAVVDVAKHYKVKTESVNRDVE